MTNWNKVGAIAGVAAVVVAVGIYVVSQDESAGDSTSTNIGNSGTTCSASGGASCTQLLTDLQSSTEEQILQASESVSDVAPVGEGPWPFVVAGDGGIGLKVRTNGLKDGHAIGGLATHHQAWVVCRSETGFEPEGKGNDTWYQITWPSDAPAGNGYLESEVSSTGRGWAFSGYLYPVMTNREVPEC